MNDQLFIVGKKDIALRLGCSQVKVLEYIRYEGLPARQDVEGGWYKITPQALEIWSQDYQARKGVKKPSAKPLSRKKIV